MTRIGVYCGSSFGASPAYRALAEAFGRACARRGLGIVYGGGSVGLMGVLANAALAAGGEVIGVIPRSMIEQEWAHNGLTKLIAVQTMHERKHRMAELADAFVALPGGIGTLEEVIEVFTWLQLGLHIKPVGLLNAAGYYDSLLEFLVHVREQGFLAAGHHAMLTVGSDAESLLDTLTTTKHVRLAKPVERAMANVLRRAADSQSEPSPGVGGSLVPSGLEDNFQIPILIENLRVHRKWIPVIARWHFESWGRLTGAETLEGYMRLLEEATKGSGVPSVLVALVDGAVVGSVSLVTCDMTIRPALTPWLAHLFVAPNYRGKGIGTDLVRSAMIRVQCHGFQRLYLYASGDVPRYYQKLGWIIEERVEFLGSERTVMRQDFIGPDVSSPPASKGKP